MSDKEQKQPGTTPLDKIQKLLAAGAVTPEQLEALAEAQRQKMRTKTGEAVKMTVTGGAPSAETVEAAPTLPSFSQAAKFLKEHGIDLNERREEHMREAIRWGLTDKQGADAYGAAFDGAQLPQADLTELVRRMADEPDMKWGEPTFEVGGTSDSQLFQRLIVDAKINHYVYRDLAGYEKIDPRTLKAYKDQSPSSRARVTFSPGILNVPQSFRGVSADRQLALMAKGEKRMTPSQWLLKFRQCADNGLRAIHPNVDLDGLSQEKYLALLNRELQDGNKRIDQYLLDAQTATQFPDLRNAGMAAPCLDFRGGLRRVDLDVYGAGRGNPNIGGRPSLG